MRKRWVALFALFLGGWMYVNALTPVTSGQEKAKSYAHGEKLFMQYCASCHGRDGKGGGPVAATLKAPMPDLTRVPLDNGKFPALRIRNVIEGEVTVPAHGTREMPVWGVYFREKRSADVAKLNSYALMRYIESIQAK